MRLHSASNLQLRVEGLAVEEALAAARLRVDEHENKIVAAQTGHSDIRILSQNSASAAKRFAGTGKVKGMASALQRRKLSDVSIRRA